MSEHKNLAEALAAFQAAAPTFKKSKTAKIGTYSYKYADLGDIVPIVNPLMAEHGLSWSAKPGRAEDGDQVLYYTLRHVSGESDSGEMSLGVGARCKPQELGSAITYGRRYALTAQLNIVTDEDDDGGIANQIERPPKVSSQPPQDKPTAKDIEELTNAAKGLTGAQIKLALTACGIDTPKPFNAVEVLSTIPKPKVVLVAEALSEMERA